MSFPLCDVLLHAAGPVLPECVLALFGVALLVIGVLRGNASTRAVHLGSVLALLSAGVMLLCLPPTPQTALFDLAAMDSFIHFSKLLVLVAALAIVVLHEPWLAREDHRIFEFPVLVLFATAGLLTMVSANDFLSVYLGLELSSLSLYVLAAFRRDEAFSTEAGIKYFVLGALASGMMLFGASLVYGFAGTTGFAALAHALAAQGAIAPGLAVGMVLVIVGFCFKVSAAPFHMWTPDVYQGAPTPVTAFFAAAPKAAALLLFTRVLFGPFGALAAQWQDIIAIVATASMFVGSLGAYTQSSLKRLLAYSSIGHAGFALVGLAAASPEGVKGLVVYVALYIFMTAGAFAVLMITQRSGEPIESVQDLAGLSQTRPWLAAGFSLLLFSMAGIPPLSGFFGKMLVFLAALKAGLAWLAIAGLLASVIACYYYIRLVKIMYFDAPGPQAGTQERTPLSSRAVLAFACIVTLFYVVLPSPLLQRAEAASQALMKTEAP